MRSLKRGFFCVLLVLIGLLCFVQTKRIRADTVKAASTNYLVLDRACKNEGSVTIPYLNKSSSLFVFSILREGEWKQVYCVDLGKSARSYTAMTKDDSIVRAISDDKKKLLSYIPALGYGSTSFPMSKVSNPSGMSNVQKTYGILTQGYVWSVFKGVVSFDEDGNLVGISKLKAVLKKLNQYTYDSEKGQRFIDAFVQALKARVKGTDAYSQVSQPPNLFFKTKKLAKSNSYEMQLTDAGGLEYTYTDKKDVLQSGTLTIASPYLHYKKDGNVYTFYVDKKDVDAFRKECQSSDGKESISFTRKASSVELDTLEGWRATNKNKSYQNFLYLEGKEKQKTATYYLRFNVAKEETVPITVYKKDASNQSISISGAEFSLQQYSDEQKKYETIMKFSETQAGVYTLNISKTILLDTSDNEKNRFKIKETVVPDGYSGKSAFSKVVTGTELSKGNIVFTAYNNRRKVKVAIQKVDEYLLNYKIAQFLSAKADMQFPYQDPSVYELTYKGTDEEGGTLYESDYDEFVAKVLGEQYTDEDGIFDQDAYTNELGHTLMLSYVAKLAATFDIYEYSESLGSYKTTPIVTLQTREGLSQQVTSDFIVETKDNDGKLMIRETKYPVGHESGVENVFYIEMNDGNDGKTVTLSNDATGNFVTNTVDLHKIIVQKEVNPLSVLLPDGTKVTLQNQTAKGAVFAVYANENIGLIGQQEYLYQKNDLVCTIEIGDNGIGQSPYLYPGTYKVVETKAPDGYCLSKEEKIVTLSNADCSIKMENNPVVEEIRIRKKDGEKEGYLKGAVLGLYANQDFSVDGTVVIKKDTLLAKKEIVAEETVFSNLPLGKYYVKELKAPNGYECSQVKLEFETPSKPTDKETVILYGVFSNFYKERRKLIVKKQIKTEDVYWKHGNPTFLFRVKGIDFEGKKHTFEKAITFTKEDEAKNTSTLQKEVVFESLQSGTYTVQELPVARYRLKDITNIVNGKRDGNTATFDLEQNKYGEVTFVNEKYEWQSYGHNDVAVNEFQSNNPDETKSNLKGLAVTCSDFMTSEQIDLSKLNVYAQYIDGTAKQVDIARCEVKPDKVNPIDGVFTTVIVAYEEEGVTVKTELPILYYEKGGTEGVYDTQTLKDGTLAIVGYHGSETQITIPAMIDGITVSQIGKDFEDGKYVYVKDGETTQEQARQNIKYYRVSGIERVTSIHLPNTVHTIGYAAFYLKDNIKQIDLNQVRYIRGRAFYKTGLQGSLVIPNDVISIGGAAFGYTQITSLSLSSGLQSLGDRVFYKCSNLTGTVQIPLLLDKVTRETFSGCNLTKVVFEGQLSTIASGAFADNTALCDIQFLDCHVKKIAQNAFSIQSGATLDTYIEGANNVVKTYAWQAGGRNPVFK